MRTQEAAWRNAPRSVQVQKARQHYAARQIADGAIQVPPRCDHCQSPSIVDHENLPDRVTCLSCGRDTSQRTVSLNRVRTMKAIIKAGVDLPGTNGGKQR